MDYREASPSPELRPHVRRFWGLCDSASRPGRGLERVVPDGRMEVIVHLGDPFTRVGTESRSPQPRTLLAGQLLGPLLLQPGLRVDFFAIRCEPWGARALLGIEPAALFERLPPLDELIGADAARLADAVAHGSTFAERVAAAERWCALRLRRAALPPAAVVEAARGATLDPAVRSVAALAERVGWGVRRLERAFAEHVGLAPKALLRVSRVQRLLALLDGPGPAPSLAALALRCGYVDQAHMTREFTALVGTSPARYRAETHGLQDAILDVAV